MRKRNLHKNLYNIGYVGRLNTGRNPERILDLLKYKINKKNIALHFVGVNDNEAAHIKKYAAGKKLDIKKIFFQKQVSRDESLRLMKSFDALLLLVNDNAKIKDGYGIPGKLYDYIYTNNNIFSDTTTFDNLKIEFELTVKKKYPGFVNFSVNDKKILDSAFNNVLDKILSPKVLPKR